MNPWKLATIGIALTATTAMATGLTTAYMLRPSVTAQAVEPAVAAVEPVAPSPRAAVRYVTANTVTAAPRAVPYQTAASRPVPPRVTPVAAPVATSAANDCATGTDRAMRIAKPGLLGTALGAGLGAAGGAIANGGKGAGKGALIGGIAGAALGTGYGAYKTRSECGTIFGNGTPGLTGDAGRTWDAAAPAGTPQAAMQRPRAADDGRILVYNVR